MRLNRFPSLALLCTLAVGLFIFGCDPKALGPDDDTGSTGGDNPAPVVTQEALVIGTVISLHMDMLKTALTVSAEFDTTVTVAPAPRAIFTSNCMTMTLVDAMPTYDLALDGCVDQNGTDYRGHVDLADLTGAVDGLLFLPDPDVANLIRATNDADDNYNHTYLSGSLEVAFTRDGVGVVNGVVLSNFVRHSVRSATATFTYQDMTWSGTHGAWDDFPSSGERITISWDGVGSTDVTFEGGETATFQVFELVYRVNLGDGTVSIVDQI